jgi:hypothetical protein
MREELLMKGGLSSSTEHSSNLNRSCSLEERESSKTLKIPASSKPVKLPNKWDKQPSKTSEMSPASEKVLKSFSKDI